MLLHHHHKLHFINSWIAIDATVTHENLYVTFCGISAFFRGIVVDQSTDVDKLQSLNFNNTYTYIGNLSDQRYV